MADKTSLVEKAICSKEFSYLHPYFYNNSFSLRCILGIGDTDEEYYSNSKKRALEIYNILFPKGADAIFFNYWVCDECNTSDSLQYVFCKTANKEKNILNDKVDLSDIILDIYDKEEYSLNDKINRLVDFYTYNLKFLLKYQYLYRHCSIKNLPVYEGYKEENDEFVQRNRVVCFSDGKGFDYENLIENELCEKGHDVSFVSFENECIFSVYDIRGCDVVFMTAEKMKEFYTKLEPYFLPYDMDEMKKRYTEAK